MPKAKRSFRNVPPPAEAKKRYEYDVAEPKEDDDGKDHGKDKPKETATARKTAAGKEKK
jgi:hypothetical protein